MNTVVNPSLIKEQFARLIECQQVQHAYIFEGPSGVGKKTMAKEVAKMVLCQRKHQLLYPCHQCAQCQNIDQNRHVDVIMVEKTGKTIKVDQVRQLKETVSKSGMESVQQVIIIPEAETLTVSAANSLLTFLEEPKGDVLFLLLTQSKQYLLPTIVSRCQVVTFCAAPAVDRIAFLRKKGLSLEKASLAIHLTHDNHQAYEQLDTTTVWSLMSAVWKWFVYITKRDDYAFIHAGCQIVPLVKEYDNQHQVLDLLLFLYRDLLHMYCGKDDIIAFEAYREELKRLIELGVSLEAVAKCMESILEHKKMIHQYVATQGVLEHLTLQLMDQTNRVVNNG